jgi:hypothetical protein
MPRVEDTPDLGVRDRIYQYQSWEGGKGCEFILRWDTEIQVVIAGYAYLNV